MNGSTLLIVGLGAGMDRSLAPIRAMGPELVVVASAASRRMREAGRVVPCDAHDADAVVEALARAGVMSADGVMSLGCDNPPVIARLCRMMGCSGLSEEVARDCTDKARRIEILARGGIAVPRFAVADHVEDALVALDELGLPAVVKPVDRTGSIGVAKIATSSQARGLVEQALALSVEGRIVIERFLTGTEHTVTGFCVDGEIIITGWSDRDYRDKERFSPCFFESGDTVPTQLDPAAIARVEDSVRRAVVAMRLEETFFNTDVLMTDDGNPVVVEVTGRLTGARIATEVVPLATGVDPLPNVVRLALGRAIDRSELRPTRSRAVVQRFVPCTGGVVRSVGDIDVVARRHGVHDLFWCLEPRAGVRLPRYRSADDVLAGVIATGVTIAEAERAAASALDDLPIELDLDPSELR